jgi:hypothetical protein
MVLVIFHLFFSLGAIESSPDSVGVYSLLMAV